MGLVPTEHICFAQSGPSMPQTSVGASAQTAEEDSGYKQCLKHTLGTTLQPEFTPKA